jgi:hypothetical protein
MMQHFRVTDPDFVRFLSCFDREEAITDRPSIAVSSLGEAAVEAHSPKDEVDERPVEISLNHPPSTMSDEDPARMQHFRVTDPDFVRFLSCFDREEAITDRLSIAGSSLAEAAVKAHSPKDEVEERPVATGDLQAGLPSTSASRPGALGLQVAKFGTKEPRLSDSKTYPRLPAAVRPDFQVPAQDPWELMPLPHRGSEVPSEDKRELPEADYQDSSLDFEEDVVMCESSDHGGQYSDGGSEYLPDDGTHSRLAMNVTSEPAMDMSDRDEDRFDYSDDGSDYEYQAESPPPLEKPSKTRRQKSVAERKQTKSKK